MEREREREREGERERGRKKSLEQALARAHPAEHASAHSRACIGPRISTCIGPRDAAGLADVLMQILCAIPHLVSVDGREVPLWPPLPRLCPPLLERERHGERERER